MLAVPLQQGLVVGAGRCPRVSSAQRPGAPPAAPASVSVSLRLESSVPGTRSPRGHSVSAPGLWSGLEKRALQVTGRSKGAAGPSAHGPYSCPRDSSWGSDRQSTVVGGPRRPASRPRDSSPGPVARCSASVEPAASDSILDTSAAPGYVIPESGLARCPCCLRSVMRPIRVFRGPWGQECGRRCGTSKSKSHLKSPLVTPGGRHRNARAHRPGPHGASLPALPCAVLITAP